MEIEIANNFYGLRFVAKDIDKYVYGEIYGRESSYRKESLLPLIRDGTVVEIGAHKGFFSILAGSVAERVISFEPNKENYDYFTRNIKLNNMGHITAINKAVSNTEDNRTFTVSNITPARHTLISSSFSGSGKAVEVECTTLAAILRDPNYMIDRIRLLKVDCEGAEYDIFLGCDPAVFQKIDAVVLEMHEISSIPHKMTELVQFFKQVGYTAEIYDERTMESMHLWMGYFAKPWLSNRLLSKRPRHLWMRWFARIGCAVMEYGRWKLRRLIEKMSTGLWKAWKKG